MGRPSWCLVQLQKRLKSFCVRRLIVLCVNLEVRLGMCAGRADLGSLGAHYNMSAVAALPYLNLALLKYLSCLKVI